MPVTPPGPLWRTNYLAPPGAPYNPLADPNNPSFDPANVIPPAGYPYTGDVALDTELYQRPLERVHGMGLHAPGVATGMQISTTTGAPDVQIMAGTALDASGRHIYLAVGGEAEIGPDADVPETPSVQAPVLASGVTLPTAGFTGPYYVVVQWWENFSTTDYASDPNVSEYTDTPWLQLLTAAEYDPDLHVVLGKVTLDGSSNVTAASYGDVGGIQRTSISVPAQSVQLQRAVTTSSTGADTVAWGELRAREGGGIEFVTANTGDQVNIITAGGGNFASMAVAANAATVGDIANPGITLDGSEATISVGVPGNYGDVIVNDGADHIAISLIGDTAHVIVGGNTIAGKVRMLDSNEQDTMALEGDNGSAVVQRLGAFANDLIDVDTTFFHIHGTDLALDGRSHNNNRALVDWGGTLIVNYDTDYSNGVWVQSNLQVDGNLEVTGNQTFDGNLQVDGSLQVNQNIGLNGVLSANGTPLMGNPARKVAFSADMVVGADFSGLSSSATADVVLPDSTQFSALIVSSYLQEYASGGYNAASAIEVLSVDGTGTPVIGTINISGAGDPNLHVAAWSGGGQTITFRARGMDNSIEIIATGIVYFE
jgi:hypothetical protein